MSKILDPYIVPRLKSRAPIPEHASALLPESSIKSLVSFAIFPQFDLENHILADFNFGSHPATLCGDASSASATLRALPVPSISLLNQLIPKALRALSDNQISFTFYHGSASLRHSTTVDRHALTTGYLPPWVLAWWCDVHIASGAHKLWKQSIGFLQQRKNIPSAVNLLEVIPQMHWDCRMPKVLDSGMSSITMLSTFCRDAIEQFQWSHIAFFVNVKVTHRGAATRLGSDSEPGNHWLGVIIDTAMREIQVADPFSLPPPPALIDILQWWLDQHQNKCFKPTVLRCTKQDDSFSCGILSCNAVANSILPGYSLIGAADAEGERLRMLCEILALMEDPNIETMDTTLDSRLPSPPQTATATISKTSTEQNKKSKSKQDKKAEATAAWRSAFSGYAKAESSQKSDPLESDTPAPVKTEHKRKHEDESDTNSSDTEDDNTFDGLRTDLFAGFVDLPDPPPKRSSSGKNLGGAPKKLLLERLTKRCYCVNDPEKKEGYRCIGDDCRTWFSKRSQDHVGLAAGHAITNAPSVQVERLIEKEAARKQALVDQPPAKRAKSDGTSPTEASSSSAGRNALEVMVETGNRHTRARKDLELTLALTILFCSGLPTYYASKWQFLDVLKKADDKYAPPSREIRECSYPGRAGKEAFWTVHVSTADREVYLMETWEATDVSHTGKWIKDLAMETINLIGVSRFCSSVCDSTGSTLLSRKLTVEEAPIIIPLPDICHFLSNFTKDVVKIAYFAPVIKVVRGTIKFFNTSHIGRSEFLGARQTLRISRGLQAIGKHRFGTIIHSAKSVQRCAPAITLVVERAKADFSEFEEFFQPEPKPESALPFSMETMTFRVMLAKLVNIGSPITNALMCLESNEADPGHVYLFWHAVIASMLDMIQSKDHHYPQDVQDQLRTIISHRHNELLVEKGRLYSLVYLAAAYLNPANITSDVFKPDPSDEEALRGVPYAMLYRKIGTYLNSLIRAEINHGNRQVFTRWKGKGQAFTAMFKQEWLAYSRQQYPYNDTVDEQQPLAMLKYWRSKIGISQGGQILPHIAEKIFSIRVNSMPDERTVSKFTAMTPKSRSRLKVTSIGAMAQVGQYYETQRKLQLQRVEQERISRGESEPPLRSVKFSDIRHQKLPPDSSEQAVESMPFDEDGDDWLDETEGVEFSEMAASLNTPVNLNSDRVRSMLAEQSKVTKQAGKGKEVVVEEEIDEETNDENYEVEF
ncbi:ribonuclease H-like domain-containing protein [Armillaria borealis]|uniref:Ribonuclease H-like domain-containing protein n=1 Tax=Armillaria borealis TaxID=47425 RepID=A0AA39JW41_9AGAR|nr:ribonuclease H-like domain-containing protein [Armillaria borealis]